MEVNIILAILGMFLLSLIILIAKLVFDNDGKDLLTHFIIVSTMLTSFILMLVYLLDEMLSFNDVIVVFIIITVFTSVLMVIRML